MRCGAIFIIIAGFTQADSANFKPFLPNDQPDQWKQIFNGASIAFFSFIGFDAVATAAEEVVNPSKNMPIGILASMSIVTVIYFLMCVVLCLMVPRNMISANATFAAAFEYVGLGWAKHIVAIGAILGILTSTMMGIYAPARILAGCTREGMLPPFMARVGPKQTPWVATWCARAGGGAVTGMWVFIIIAGFTQADSANFAPFVPNDIPDQWKQIFNGASIAFFSFIGFDAVATAAEEVVNPS
ncbi:Cationic amino acid transporter 1, partial [Tetrabaena socialis]